MVVVNVGFWNWSIIFVTTDRWSLYARKEFQRLQKGLNRRIVAGKKLQNDRVLNCVILFFSSLVEKFHWDLDTSADFLHLFITEYGIIISIKSVPKTPSLFHRTNIQNIIWLAAMFRLIHSKTKVSSKMSLMESKTLFLLHQWSKRRLKSSTTNYRSVSGCSRNKYSYNIDSFVIISTEVDNCRSKWEIAFCGANVVGNDGTRGQVLSKLVVFCYDESDCDEFLRCIYYPCYDAGSKKKKKSNFK